MTALKRYIKKNMGVLFTGPWELEQGGDCSSQCQPVQYTMLLILSDGVCVCVYVGGVWLLCKLACKSYCFFVFFPVSLPLFFSCGKQSAYHSQYSSDSWGLIAITTHAAYSRRLLMALSLAYIGVSELGCSFFFFQEQQQKEDEYIVELQDGSFKSGIYGFSHPLRPISSPQFSSVHCTVYMESSSKVLEHV